MPVVLALTGGAEAAWLEQIHGAEVVDAHEVLEQARAGAPLVRADASVTNRPGTICVVMIADCMPVLLCDAEGRAVGAAHAGWRGLAAGVVEKTAQRVAALAGVQPGSLHAYLGPSIGPAAFEVGADVRDAFMNGVDGSQREATAQAFVPRPGSPGKYLADLPALARLRLQRFGVTQITGGDLCTVDRTRALLFIPARSHDGPYGRDDLACRLTISARSCPLAAIAGGMHQGLFGGRIMNLCCVAGRACVH